MPGELHGLLERCRADEAPAWEHLADWVKLRARAILGGLDRLSAADGDDAVAETLKSLVTVVRRGEIRGISNAEIDAYVCTALRNRALNLLRGRARRREGEPRPTGETGSDSTGLLDADVPGEPPTQDARAMAAQELQRAEQLLLSWLPEDRYLFIAKLNGVSAQTIQRTLERSPFEVFVALTTIDTRFHRLRRRLIERLTES